jgi:hypothetical protein
MRARKGLTNHRYRIDISDIVGTAGSHSDVTQQIAAKLKTFVKTMKTKASEKSDRKGPKTIDIL